MIGRQAVGWLEPSQRTAGGAVVDGNPGAADASDEQFINAIAIEIAKRGSIDRSAIAAGCDDGGVTSLGDLLRGSASCGEEDDGGEAGT